MTKEETDFRDENVGSLSRHQITLLSIREHWKARLPIQCALADTIQR